MRRNVTTVLRHFSLLFVLFVAHLQSNHAIRPYHRYSDEFDPFSMMEVNQAYPSNMMIRNGIGFHFAYSFQTVKDELYLFRRIDIKHIATAIQVLMQAADAMEKHCEAMQPSFEDDYEEAASAQGTVKKYHDNFFMVTPDIVSQEVGEKLCEQSGGFLPEVFHQHELNELVELMVSNQYNLKFTMVHSGLRQDLSKGVRRFITSGLPAGDGVVQNIYTHTGYTMETLPIYRYYRDYRSEWYYMDHSKFKREINGNMSPDGFNARCNGYACNKGNAVNTLPGANLICQRVISPPANARMRPITRDQDESRISIETLKTIPRQQLIEVANEYHKYCRSTTTATETAGLTLNKRLRNTLEHINVRMNDIKSDPNQNISQVWATHIAQRNIKRKRDQPEQQESQEQDDGSTADTQDELVLERPKRLIAKVLMTGLSSLIGSGIARLIRYHYGSKKEQEKTAKLHAMVTEQSVKLDNLELQAAQFDSIIQDVVARVSNLESTTGTLMMYSARLAEILSYAELLNSAITNLEYAISRLEAIAHSSQEGGTHMFAVDEHQMEKAKNLVARNTAGLLKEDLANMKSGFIVDPTDPDYLVLVINSPTLSRDVYVAAELVPIHFFQNGGKYRQVLKSQYFAMDSHAKIFYEMEEKDFIECRQGRCIQKSLTKRINDHPCEFPLKASKSEMYGCAVEKLRDTEPFFKMQHPDGVFYSVERNLTSTLTCPNLDWVHGLDPSHQLVRHGTIHIPQGCSMEIKKPGTIELTIPGPPIFKVIDLGEIDFAVKPEADGSGLDISRSTNVQRILDAEDQNDRVNALEVHVEKADIISRAIDSKLDDFVKVISVCIGLVALILTVMAILVGHTKYHFEGLRAKLPSYFQFSPPDSLQGSDTEESSSRRRRRKGRKSGSKEKPSSSKFGKLFGKGAEYELAVKNQTIPEESESSLPTPPPLPHVSGQATSSLTDAIRPIATYAQASNKPQTLPKPTMPDYATFKPKHSRQPSLPIAATRQSQSDLSKIQYSDTDEKPVDLQ